MIGIDIMKISRVEKLYEKFGGKFLNKIFNEEEINYINNKKNNIQTVAGMYAAKEAVSKAIGTGIGENSFKDIKIFHTVNAPYAECKGKDFKLSISHDGGLAICVAVASKNFKNKSLNLLGERKKDTYKGEYGRVAIVAGSKGMSGSAYLSSTAALRMGSGLVYNLVPEDIIDIMSIKYVEPIVKTFSVKKDLIEFLKNMDAIAIGPGIGFSNYAQNMFEEVLKQKKNILVDADALTILAKNLKILKNRKEFTTILTPHTGEFSRLTGLSYEEINKNREKLAKEFAKKYKIILLLKGNNTIITDGVQISINKTGNPGMATAGSGDVLTGIISSLLGRAYSSYEAAELGAKIHGLAGDFAAAKYGENFIIASDIVKFLSSVI